MVINVRFGIIGCGKIAQEGHIPALKKLSKRIELVAVADINLSVAKKIAKRYKIPFYFKDYRKLLRRDDVDAVIISTPTPYHAQISINAAEAGKHILVEKPLAMTLDEALEIERVVKLHNVKISVVQNYRYFPAVKTVKRRIQSGYLGRIVSLFGVAHTKFPILWTRSLWLYHEGGALYDFAPHLIDMLLWLKGIKDPKQIVEVNAAGGDFLPNAGFINHAQLFIKFKDKSSATADISWITDPYLFNIQIFGTGGRITLDVRFNTFIEEHGTQTPLDFIKRSIIPLRDVTRDILRKSFFKGALSFYSELIYDFVEYIEKKRPPPVSLKESIASILVIDKALKLLRQGGL